jgi:hypothetical protein
MTFKSRFTPKLGWKILNVPRKHNNYSLPKIKEHPLFLTLNPPIHPLLPSFSIYRN